MSRVLYSTEAVLPKWVPSVVVNYLTKTVLIEVSQPLSAETYPLLMCIGDDLAEARVREGGEGAALSWRGHL
jgi:hypothetical protein